jgi:pyruvate,orthophosphate dikinase
MNNRKYLYAFEDGDGKNKMLLGGKGANLCEMTQLGLNVPPGFVISAEACLVYLEKNQLPAGLMDEIRGHVSLLEKKTGKGFGGGTNPLLVSVRSGSAMSMPGMMDTILNLGLNEASLAALIGKTSNERFAYDASSSSSARSPWGSPTSTSTSAWRPSRGSTARGWIWSSTPITSRNSRVTSSTS